MQLASPLTIAQITDTHLLAAREGELLGVPTASSFATVVERLKAIDPRPDLLLLTGDLSQDETLASYERVAAEIAPLGIRTHWLPGNHDRPDLMAKALNQPPLFAEKSFRAGSWNIILLDSTMPGKVLGRLSAETLRWLEEQLQHGGERPTLIGLHHPPFEIDSAWIDRSRLQNPEELFAVLDRYPQVRLVLFGHIHQDFHREREGVSYYACPSTSVQFRPQCQQFRLDDRDPGFRLLSLAPDGSFETRVERVPLEAVSLNLSATGY